MTRLLPFLLLASLLGDYSFGQDSEPPAAVPMPAQYESPGVLPSTSFLAPQFLQSSIYQIDPSVYNDGTYNTWRVYASGSVYDVTGNERLMILLREVAATAAIESESNVKRFGEAMKDAGEDQLRNAQKVLRNPGQTIQAIPQGASRLFGRIGNTIKHAADGELDTSGDGNAGDTAKKLMGVDSAKRQLASEFGVNPYSKNAALQKALSDAAWATSLGKITMNLASGFVAPAGVSNALTGINVADYLTDDQVKMKPEDLEKANRAKLSKMEVQDSTADLLFSNPNYDPWTLSAMINAFGPLNLGPQTDIFFASAGGAATDVDAYFFFRNAQLIANYHKNIAPITQLESNNRVVFCMDQNGKLIAPLWLDYVMWTPGVEAAAGRLQTRASNDPANGVVILATGDFSPLATSKLQGMGFQVIPRAFLPQSTSGAAPVGQ